jgi:competence protein ComEC
MVEQLQKLNSLTITLLLSPEQYQDDFQPGAIIRLRARLLPPAGPSLPGGYDFARRAWLQQIGATGTALGEVQLFQKADGDAWFATQRTALTEHILASMPQGSGAIGAALVTGDRHLLEVPDLPAVMTPRRFLDLLEA